MTAKSTKGLTITITDITKSPTKQTITGITAGVVAAADTTGIAKGAVISFKGTGVQQLDTGSFVVGDVTANTSFEVLGAKSITASTLPALAEVDVHADADSINLCLSSIAFSTNKAGTISVATFCAPTASIPSPVVEAGTVTFGGFVDTTAKDYPALQAALADGLTRIMKIALPGNGFILAPIIVSDINWDLPLDGAIGYTVDAVLGAKPTHVY